MAIQLANYQATLSWDASEYKKGMTEAESSFNSFGSKMGSIGKGIVAGIGVAIAAATTAIVAFGKSSLDAGMEFDAAVSQIAATMGTTTDQIQNLRDKAQELGASTSFSATQAAEGLNVLAMSGLTAEEQISAIDTVLNLAAAGAIEMADAASYTIGAVKGFGDSCDNAQYYADLMAKGATLAATDVRGLGEALSGSAATAASYGQSADSVTLSLLRLAEQNVTGSTAATALNRAMADLYIPTDAAAGALKELGISAYDAEGNARDFNDVVDELNGALAGMSEEEANAYKGAIFTSQGLKAFNMMTVSSTEKVNEFKEGLASASDGIGSAAQQATTMLDNLQGDITIFKSAVEGLQIGVSDTISGLMRDTVQFGTEQITILTDAVKQNGLTGLAGAVGEVLVNIINKITEYIPQVLNLGIQVIKSLLDGIRQSVGDIANIAAEIVTTLVTGIVDLLPDVIQVACDVVVALCTALAEQLPTLIPVIIEGILTAAQTLIDNLPILLDALLQVVQGLAQGILDSIPIIIEKLPELILSIVNFILGAIPQIIQTGIDLLTSLVAALPDIITAIVAAIPQIIDGLIKAILGSIPQIVQAGIDLLVSLVQNLPTIIIEIVKAIPDIISAIIDAIINNIPLIIETGVQLFMALIENLPTIIIELVKAMPQIIVALVEALGKGVAKFAEVGANLVKGLWEGIKSLASWLWDKVSGWISSIWDGICDFFGIHSPSRQMGWIGEMLVEGLSGSIEDNGDEAVNASQELAGNVLDTFENMADDIADIEKGALGDSQIKKAVTLSTTYDKAAIPNSISANLNANTSNMADSLNIVFDRFIDKADVMIDKLIRYFDVGNENGVNSSVKSITINMGNNTVSGVIDKGAAEQVKEIADNQVDEFLDAIAPYIPIR